MYRCNQCGQYYVPGYLECACRTTSQQIDPQDPPAAARAPKDQAPTISPHHVEKSTLKAISVPRPTLPTDNAIVSGKQRLAQAKQGAKGG